VFCPFHGKFYGASYLSHDYPTPMSVL
jgi:hypothetical protein